MIGLIPQPGVGAPVPIRTAANIAVKARTDSTDRSKFPVSRHSVSPMTMTPRNVE